MKSTMVLVCGCHVAADLEGKDWTGITFGDKEYPTLEGRVVMGLQTVVEQKAHFLRFGTGASSADGQSEAAITKAAARSFLPRITELLQLDEQQIDFLSGVLAYATLDEDSLNTCAEVKLAMVFCMVYRIDRLVIVSSPWHIQRAYTYALDLANQVRRDGNDEPPDIIPVASYGSTASIAISEPPHRGDRPKVPIHTFIRRADSLGRSTKTAEGFAGELQLLLEKWEKVKQSAL
jgi:hypothetical protein